MPKKTGGPVGAIMALLMRDLRLARREPMQWALPLVFFVLAASLVPLSFGARTDLLRATAPGILWLCALFAALLAHEGMFHGDMEDGSLDLQLASPHPLALLLGARMAAHWLVSGLPSVLAGPVLATMFGISGHACLVLAATMLLGTPLLSLLGTLGSALTVGSVRGSALLGLLILPLCVPPLIFATAAVYAAAAGLPVGGHLLILGAMLVLGITLIPLACATGLRAVSRAI